MRRSMEHINCQKPGACHRIRNCTDNACVENGKCTSAAANADPVAALNGATIQAIADKYDREIVAELKPTNPKDAIGSDKLPLHLWPETASALGCLGLLDGALKYGRANFRAIGVRSSIYYDAARRHLNKWFEGEDNDPDSGLPHLAHVLACVAIVVDAQAAGKLNDDRQVAGGYPELVSQLTPHVKRLKELHASKTPKHYTIADDIS
jgi:hypothetical protein